MKRILCSIIIAAAVSACAPQTRAPFADPKATAEEQDRQKRAAVKRIAQYGERVFTVGHRVLVAGADFCKKTKIEEKTQIRPLMFPEELRQTAIQMGYREENDPVGPKVSRCHINHGFNYKTDINAFTDGSAIVITQGMIDFAKTDDELALVFAHELAHAAMGHIEAKKGNAAVGAVLGAIASVAIGVNVTDIGANAGAAAYSQEFESEADYVGLYMLARAGYSIDGAPEFWERMGSAMPGAITHASSHPNTAERAVRIRAAIEEIKGKQARGEELKPEMKEKAKSDPPV